MITEADIIHVQIKVAPDFVPPMPRHIGPNTSAATRRFVALGDEVVIQTLQIPRPLFVSQLVSARNVNAALVGTDSAGTRYGVMPAGSKIKYTDTLLRQNLFVPEQLVSRPDKRLERLFLAYFIRADPLAAAHTVEVAGWLDLRDVVRNQQDNPSQLSTRIKVISVPCTQLQPMSTFPKLTPETNV